MKKTLLLMLCVLFAVAKSQTCTTPMSVPFSETFSTGTLPPCWTNQNAGSTNANALWKFTGLPEYGATNQGRASGTFAWVDASSPYAGLHNVELLSPQISLAGLTVPYVQFEWFKNHLTSATGTVPNYDNNRLKVEINNGSGWTQIFSDTSNNSQWREVGIPLAASYAGTTIQLKFTVDKDVAGNGNFYDDLALDNVKVMEAPTCFKPTSLVINTIAQNSVSISWTAPAAAPALGYDVYYSTSNTPPTAATVLNATNSVQVTTTSATIPGLTPNTTYYIWVRSKCTASDKSDWQGPINAYTGVCIPPNGTSTSYYMAKILTTGASTNLNYIATSYTTTHINNTATTIQTYPGNTINLSLAANGTSTAYFYGWVDWNNDLVFNNTAGNPERLFATTSYSNTYNGSFTVPAGTPAGSYTVRFALSGSGTLTSPCGPGGYANYIDYTLVVGTPPTCISPTALTVNSFTSNSAIVSWTAPTTPATLGYDVYYSTSNTPPNAGTVLNATNSVQSMTTTATIPGLNPNTIYYVWVRAKCTATDSSFWAGPVSVYTGVCIPPNGTSTSYYYNKIQTTGGWTNLNYNANAYTTTYINNTATTLQTSPGATINVSLKAGGTSTVYFYGWADWNGDLQLNNAAGNPERLFTTTSYNNLYTGSFTVPAGTPYGSYTLRFALSGSGALTSPCGPGNYANYVDYTIVVGAPPTCMPPTAFVLTGATTTSATVSWTASAPAPAGGYQVYYNTTGVPPNAATVLNGTNSVATTTTTATIPGLTPNTTYYIWVRAKCSNTDQSPWVGSITVYTNYCAPTGGTSSTTYYVNNVTTTGGLTNLAYTATTYNAYVNNSAQSFSVVPGGSANITVGGSGTASKYYYAWIDWNNDMVFDTTPGSPEIILATTSYSTTPGTAVINAGTYPSGDYRIRFAISESGVITPCGPAPYGNYVDYTFRIIPCSTTAPTITNVNAITDVNATVNWALSGPNLNVIVKWREVGTTGWPAANSSGIIPATPTNYQITGLQASTAYEVIIIAVCGTTEGTPSAITPFSTTCDPAPPFLTVSQIAQTQALISWNATANATFALQYRKVGSATWLPTAAPGYIPVNGTSYLLTGLDPYTKYEVKVANICVSAPTVVNTYSTPAVFTTLRTCDMPVPGLTITYMTTTTAQVQWDPFPGATYVVRYRKVGISSWTQVPSATNNLTITGLLEDTKYEMQVANVCSGVTGSWSDPYYFTTPTIVYCSMTAGSAGNEYISGVVVKNSAGVDVMKNDQNNIASTYSNFTTDDTKIVTLVQGSTGNQLVVSKKWAGTQENAGLAAWIDFNRDGIFQPTERIMASEPSKNSPITATFNVPSDAFVSMTDYKYVVMRVALSRNEIPVNCVSMANGEVEDYLVRITKTPIATGLNPDEIVIYPNPVTTILYVKNMEDRATYKIYNAAGQLLKSGIILAGKVDVSGLIKGVYVIDLQDSKNNVQKKFIKN